MPAGVLRLAIDGGFMWWRPSQAGETAGAALFDPASHGAAARQVGVGGRQAAWFIVAGGREAVLRHYRRGGLVGRLIERSYLWTGEARTRPVAEFSVMDRLHAAGLPVPQPLAAAVWRAGLSYRGALVTARVPGARALAERLGHGDDAALCQAAAGVIARMHAHGVWHADLNAYNILFDADDAAWLIDFDRAREGQLDDAARLGNLARLQRSLEKVAGAPGRAWGERIRTAYDAIWRQSRPFSN